MSEYMRGLSFPELADWILTEYKNDGSVFGMRNIYKKDGDDTLAIFDEKIPPMTALKVATVNPSRILKLAGKGEIREGLDADLVLLDPAFNILHVMAMGKILV